MSHLKKIILVFCFFCGGMYAQEKPGQPNELDDKYLPGENSLFNNESSSSSNKNNDEFKNIISFNPTMMLRQIASLEYSRKVVDYVAVQAGIGLCFGQDFIASMGNNSELLDGRNNTYSTDSLVTYYSLQRASSFSKNSLFSTFSVKFLLDDDWGSYIEVNSRFYSNNFSINESKLNSYNNYYGDKTIFNGTPDFKVTNTVFNILLGGHAVSDGKIGISHDFFVGFGLRIASYNTYQVSTIKTYDPSSSYYSTNSTVIYNDAPEKQKIYAPSIVFGYKVGIGF
jgi:hypothetical protein